MQASWRRTVGDWRWVIAVLWCLGPQPSWSASKPNEDSADLWKLARRHAPVHRFSTLFTAQDVRQYLSSDEGRARAMSWCKASAVTHVYLETFRDGYQADRAVLEQARETFRKAEFIVSGCITPTQVGKPSTGWKPAISCYTDSATQEKVGALFEFAAGLFDEIMIDDFWFTDCACPACEAARLAQTVTLGERHFPVKGDTWENYRCELMLCLSRERVLAAARRVNPNARLIIKYPQWYDRFHERGYDVARETDAFDKIWVGTETRDYADPRWGGTVQYEAYFIMRWLGAIGGQKCGGGWYDWLGTTEATYLEQARQTILGGARESLLFCFGGLQGSTGPKNVATLRKNIPELLDMATEVHRRQAIGIAAYKPANSHPDKEARVFDFVGMLGLPLAPCAEFPTGARAAFFSVHALKDPDFNRQLRAFIKSGKPVLLTDGLVAALGNPVEMNQPNVQVLPVKGDPKGLLQIPGPELNALRNQLLKPFQVSFSSPSQTGLYLFQDGSWVVENFNHEEVAVQLNGESLKVGSRGWRWHWH